ncbi:glycoside hydrolase [Priestia taiwanensis]|uniref:Glycosyl hydrolases related to GH101 family, GHL1-GHL3 n=1 Tax=Priestia taiwanensis TaxID=1347902 RepID=A0A917ANR0_9BACI|nr:glycoside hydrolase [Priestia taiwanensis]MBM7362683.1 hypothetical protein [Priestia taiwanensis]GGE64231.1 hypothetical protein GCM10007140_13080 [Priestia taiwanensis]
MNKKIKYFIIPATVITLIATASIGYYVKNDTKIKEYTNIPVDFNYGDFAFDVNPETGEIIVEKDGVKESASMPLPKQKVSNVKQSENLVSWDYPDEKMSAKVEKKEHYLDISFTSNGASEFEWPKVSAKSYMLPIGEGKYIPSDDKAWKEFLKDEELALIESFSMPFFALNKSDYSILYIADKAFNNTLHFNTDDKIQFSMKHEFPSINENKEYGFRLYVTENNPTHVAQIYKNYIIEKGEFKTLQQKAESNPNIEKLYGAPHIYFWADQMITEDDIHWNKIREQMDAEFVTWMKKLLTNHTEDGAGEFETIIAQVKNQDYVDKYQKRVITTSINQVLKVEQFYNPDIFPDVDSKTKKLLDKGVGNLSEQELYECNKGLLKGKLKDATTDLDTWAKKTTTDVMEDMYDSGITKAWVGLSNWANGLMNPAMVEQANDQGYLIGPYDSYHSIHEKGNRDWNTASFEDKSLYEEATIINKEGKYIHGFLGRGRKLNPTLSLPSVQSRTGNILQNGILFNSWFIDCDATGEIYDDYSPHHPTTQEEDLQARLERMDYIAKERGMVIGSEGGNDFASSVIAFAHGIETPVIKWADADMRKNKDSEYYVGGYWAPSGNTPDRYGKQVPIKSEYRNIYIDPAYSIPLYKLVYNDSVITTHHWEWGSLKIKDEVGNRMLTELLHNIPPLYHVDEKMWNENEDMLVNYLSTWSPFHEKAVKQPMTSFKTLTEDRLVQSTEFGEELKVVVNYSADDFKYEGETIKAKTAVIYGVDGKQVFDASAY